MYAHANRYNSISDLTLPPKPSELIQDQVQTNGLIRTSRMLGCVRFPYESYATIQVDDPNERSK